jgi:hypothetical protein
VSDPNQVTPILKYSKVVTPGIILSTPTHYYYLTNIIHSCKADLKVPTNDAEHSQGAGNIRYTSYLSLQILNYPIDEANESTDRKVRRVVDLVFNSLSQSNIYSDVRPQ